MRSTSASLVPGPKLTRMKPSAISLGTPIARSTSLAFILGVLPLVIASGAGAEARRAVGAAVFFGMAGVTLFGLLFTPVFYLAIRRVVGPRLAKHQPPRMERHIHLGL